MYEELIEALTAAKRRIEEDNGTLRDGSLGKFKNDKVLAMINKLLPKKQISLDPRNYNPDLVYPNNNFNMSDTNVATQKPQMQVMQVLQQTPPAQIAELDFVRDKFVKNYNQCHQDQNGELQYHRQMVFFKQAINNSDSLKNADPFSLYACFLTIAVKNYSLDPEDQEVYLFCQDGKKAKIQRQAGAHVRRLIETRQILYVEQPKIVYQGDDFKVSNGRVIEHIENFATEIMIAGYVRFVLPGNADRYFIYRKSDWEAWRKKSRQAGGDNWNGNNNQPGAAFLRTKLLLHAAKEKAWATGTTNPTVEQFDVEVDEDDELSKLPEPSQNGTYQPTLIVSGIGEMKDESFVQSEQKEPAATVVYSDDDF
jgi:hypothetical protein